MFGSTEEEANAIPKHKDVMMSYVLIVSNNVV